jgi:hypothetical protein
MIRKDGLPREIEKFPLVLRFGRFGSIDFWIFSFFQIVGCTI